MEGFHEHNNNNTNNQLIKNNEVNDHVKGHLIYSHSLDFTSDVHVLHKDREHQSVDRSILT